MSFPSFRNSNALLLPRILTSPDIGGASYIRGLFYHTRDSTAENLHLRYAARSSALTRKQLAYEMLWEREYVLPSYELHQLSKASLGISKNSLVPAVGDPSLAYFADTQTRLSHLGQWRQSCLISYALKSCAGTLRHWHHLHGYSLKARNSHIVVGTH